MKRLWLWILVTACLAAVAGGALLAVQSLKAAYQQGLQAYQAQDVVAAATQFARVASFPPFLGDFVSQAQERTVELGAFRLAQTLWEQGQDYAAAYAALQNFQQHFPQSAFAEVVAAEIAIYEGYQQAVALRQQGDYEQATAAFQAYLKKYPNGPFAAESGAALQQIPFEWADQLAAAGQYARAVQVLEDAGELPNILQQKAADKRQQLLLDWAAAETKAENYAQAEALYLQLIQESELKLDTSLSQVYFGWGKQLAASGKYLAAAAKYRQAAALANLSQTAQDEAERLADQALLDGGAAMLKSGNQKAAGELYAQLLAEGSPEAIRRIPAEAAEALLVYAEDQLAQGKTALAQKAFAYLVEHLSADPEMAKRSTLGLGRAALAQGDLFSAAAAFQQALDQLKTLPLAQQATQKAAAQAALDQALFGISQFPIGAGAGQALAEIFSAMAIDERRLNFTQKRCARNLCFSPQELQAAHQAVGREVDASLFYNYGSAANPAYLAEDQHASRLGNLRYAVRMTEELVKLQTCRYSLYGIGSPTNFLVRRQLRINVEIYDLVSGRKVSTQSVSGSNPPACPQRRGFSSTTEYSDGSYPAPEQVQAVFKRYLKTVVFNRTLLKDAFGDNRNQWPLTADAAAGWRGAWELSAGTLQASGAADQAFHSLLLPSLAAAQTPADQPVGAGDGSDPGGRGILRPGPASQRRAVLRLRD